jgi:NAD(P)H-flavin reductase
MSKARRSPYSAVPAKVEDVIVETPTIKTLVFKPETPISFEAGQFIELSIPGFGEAPFTPSSSPAEAGRMEVTIMKVGSVTERVHELENGDEVGIRGPLGVPYPLDEFKGKEICIVGGGVGLAPLRALLFALFEDMKSYKRIILRYGARTPADLVYREAVSKGWGRKIDVVLTVDEGDKDWKDNVGVVTTICEKDKLKCHPNDGVAVVCGPPIMMKFATLKLLERGYPKNNIYLSMEKNMSCGIGKCGHCRIGPYYACKDGPVFSYDRIENEPRIWD